ncbi:HAD family hydrolase [Paraglaciecola sp. 2405UD69-4]|uniref:HAD family hydrolase n=1 Tax=Paraglaciecola sp. 2405UD69-4 TaxID=3391836 RepID=UPI0039C8D20A
MTKHYLFDWGDTLMVDIPNQTGPMCHWPEVKVVPGAVACLERLSQQANCHLATNAADSSEAEIRLALTRAGLSGYLTHIFCRENLGVGKTDPSYYQKIVNKLGVNREQVIMVGDSLERDVLPAMDAGIQAIWFNHQRKQVPAKITAIEDLSYLV